MLYSILSVGDISLIFRTVFLDQIEVDFIRDLFYLYFIVEVVITQLTCL